MMWFSTDVLVVGSGAAGLRAAIEVREQGLDALVVSKAPAGYNNCTIMAGAGFLAAVGGMTPEEHVRRTLGVGKGLNHPGLVEVLAAEGGERVLELERFGCVVNVGEGGVHVGGPGDRLGQGITLPMVRFLRGLGGEFLENTILTRLVTRGGRVVGALGYNSQSDEAVAVQAGSVVLASGGAGALYSRTDCPLRTTGDGYALAVDAGARLRDMEFSQFFPLALAEPGAPSLLVDGRVVWEGKIINTLGEDIPAKHGVTERPYIAKSRDLLSRAMMLEVLDGLGVEGAVLLDAREVARQGGPGERYGMVSWEYFKELGGLERTIRIAPLSHFTMGGVVADAGGATGVPGLYVAGEAMGGVHGANRHGGNALTEAVVFAVRAARSACRDARSGQLEGFEEEAEAEEERLRALTQSETGYTPATLMGLLRETMWEKAGVVRTSQSLVEAYQKIQEIRDSSRRLLAKPGRQLMDALELQMALQVAEFMVRAAMARRESRGAHYRRDYPGEDPAWAKTLVLSKEGEAVRVEEAPIDLTP